MAPIFSFNRIDMVSTDRNKLEKDLHEYYDMPTDAWCHRAETRFALLRKYFEIGTKTAAGEYSTDESDNGAAEEDDDSSAEESDSSTDGMSEQRPRNYRELVTVWVDELSASSGEVEQNDESNCTKTDDDPVLSPMSVRPAGSSPKKSKNTQRPSLPRVSICKGSTFLLDITSTNEPIICQAFGTPDPARYQDIFWERVEKIKLEQRIAIEVVNIDTLTPGRLIIFMRFDGFYFKLRYLQWWELVVKFPRVLEASPEFLENSDPSLSSSVLELQHGTKIRKETSIGFRLAYYYIRAWCTNRGMYERRPRNGNEDSIIASSTIVSFLTRPPPDVSIYLTLERFYKIFSDNKYRMQDSLILPLSEHILRFFEHFDREYASLGSPRLGRRPYVEDTAQGWVELLETLRTQPIEEKLDCPLYVKIDAVITGSSINGGEWLRKVEERLLSLRDDILKSCKGINVYPWRYRLVPSGPQSPGTFEGSYVFGLSGPNSMLQEDSIDKIAKTWRDRLNKTTERGSNGDFQSLNTKVLRPAALGDSTYVKCSMNWPHVSMKPPERAGSVEAPVLGANVPKDKTQLLKVAGEPGNFLRPAKEVLSRIRYNPGAYNIDQWIIGYKDRFNSGLQEKPASQWVTETTDETFIPEHRIEQFKLCPEGGEAIIMWDKATKLDLIFGYRKGKANKNPTEERTLTKRERKQVAKEEKSKGWQRELTSEDEQGEGGEKSKENRRREKGKWVPGRVD